MFRHRNSVVIIGGGLAGLTNAILLNRSGFQVTLVEKKKYPFHRVCGEYISNEALPFLNALFADFKLLEFSTIEQLAVSSVSGRLFTSPLDLGGFGLSRYTLDRYLSNKAIEEGVDLKVGLRANSVEFKDDEFSTELSDSSILCSDFVISAHGKRSNLDKQRPFFHQRSPYLGVKYHIETDFPTNLIQLDNFEGGYAGTVKVEGDKFCLCYLTRNDHLKKYGSVQEMEKNVLYKNQFLEHLFHNSAFLWDKPEVINEISFEQKSLVEDHVFYCGDAAGMIAPLCGNGMAIAIHSAKILSEVLFRYRDVPRNELESIYQIKWNRTFEKRLRTGRLTQNFFGKKTISELAVRSLQTFGSLANSIIRRTHGARF